MLKRVGSAIFEAPVGSRIQVIAVARDNHGIESASFQYGTNMSPQLIDGHPGCAFDVVDGDARLFCAAVFAPGAAAARYDLMEVVDGAHIDLQTALTPDSAMVAVHIRGVSVGFAPGPVARKPVVKKLSKPTAARKPPPRVEARAEEETPPTSDAVMCSVYCPPSLRAGDQLLVQVFAHLEGDLARVHELARTYDHASSPRGSASLASEIERGQTLSFALSLSGAQADDPVQTMRWTGRPESVQFGVTAANDHPGGAVVGTLLVSDGTVPLGRVKFRLDVFASRERYPAETSPSPKQEWKRFQHAFISYASEDRAEVLKRVQMLARIPIDFFQDLLSLDPGERWERRLYEKIDESDVLFLFWSSAAKNSEWVLKEVRYAIERQAGDETAPPEIVPVIIEGPPLVPPPSELKHLHFNDRFLYFIAGSS